MQHTTIRPPLSVSPFDAAAVHRLQHMGLLDADHIPNEPAVSALSRAYAGVFYDDLCETYDTGQVQTLCAALFTLRDAADTRSLLLSICAEYDRLLQALPAPIWWLSGTPPLIRLFVSGFVDALEDLRTKGGETD